MNPFEKISDVFHRAQFNTTSHVRCCRELKTFYQNVDFHEFLTAFNQCLLSPFKMGECNMNVERTLDFAALFCVNPILEGVSQEGYEEDDGEVEMNPLLRGVLLFLFKKHQASDSAVRFRICQFVNKLLVTLGDNAYIDADLCNKMCDCMMDRLKDKSPAVRAQAVQSLERLQEPTQKNCPIVNALLFHLNNDPSPEVRQMTVKCICRTSTTIPSIVEHTADIKDEVRHSAYVTLSRIHIKSLSIKKRAIVISQGLGDKSPHVRRSVETNLLSRWLAMLDGDYLKLLHAFHVENYTKMCEEVLNVFFNKNEVIEHQIFDFLKSECDLNNQVIPLETLTPEQAFLWRCFVQHCRKKNQDEYIDVLIPDLTPFCTYINKFYSLDKKDSQLGLSDSQREFIILQLLEIAKDYDFSDEMGRAELKQLVLNMIFNIDIKDEVIPFLMHILVQLEPSTIARMQILAERISELHEPIDLPPSKEDENVTQERKLLNREILGMTQKWEQLIEKQDYSQAAACKETLLGLHTRLDQMPPENESSTQMLSKFLTIIFEMMQPSNVISLTPQLRSLMDNFVMKFITDCNLKVRNLALKCIAAFCCLDLEVAKVHMMTFYQELVHSNYAYATCPTSLKSIFDIILVFGLEPFNLVDKLDYIPESNYGEIGEMSTLLLAIIVKIIDDEASMEMRTIAAEGFCKLTLCGKVRSHSLLTKLLLSWFNPVFKTNEKMKQMLALFFTTYPSNCDWALHIFVKAFIPTLNYLMNLDLDSPLHSINIHSLAKLMVNLTKKGINPKVDENVHDNLALVLCNHILMDPTDDIVPILVRSLGQLQLTTDDDQHVHLNDLVDQMLKVVKDKLSLRTLTKFKKNQELLHKTLTVTNLSVRRTSAASRSAITVEKEPDNANQDSRIELEKIIEEMSSSLSATPSPPPRQKNSLGRRPLAAVLESDDSGDRLPIKSVCKLSINSRVVIPDSDEDEPSD